MDRWLGNAHLLYHYGRILQAGVFFQGDGYKETQHHCDPNGFFSVPMFIISIFEKGFMTTLLKVANPYSMIHGVSWFFICTLWCYVINYILHKYIHNSKLLFLAMIVLSAVSYYITSTYSFHGHKLVLPLFCSTALTAMGYLAIGEFVRKYFLYGGFYLADNYRFMYCRNNSVWYSR